jgi:hypothetical protein
MNKGRVGEERRDKETDGCPLTLTVPQRCLEAPWTTLSSSVRSRFPVYCGIHMQGVLKTWDQACDVDSLSPAD